mmetsp:Transcript_22026/g.61224  ORF Transcript_22026/g.61224 Transcript_22026/m.61224 type:complete len:128 (-) Transcript_22026:57-440(-)
MIHKKVELIVKGRSFVWIGSKREELYGLCVSFPVSHGTMDAMNDSGGVACRRPREENSDPCGNCCAKESRLYFLYWGYALHKALGPMPGGTAPLSKSWTSFLPSPDLLFQPFVPLSLDDLAFVLPMI